MIRSALSAALMLVFVLLAPRAEALDVNAETFTLANGMQVVVIPDNRAPVVTQMVWYRVGAADEPKGQAGIAHFLEHLMFKGTEKIPPGEFSKIIKKNGGEDNAFTSQDYTAYFQSIAKDRLALAMELEAERMQNLQLTDPQVLPERDVIGEERRSRIENDPASLMAEQINAALYTAHPYGKPVIGWMSEVEKLTRQNALDFYRTYYTPQNAILIVAGDVTADEVRPLAEKYYGTLANTANPPPRMRTPEPAPLAARRVSMTDPRVSVATLQRTYIAPSYRMAKGKPTAEALDLLSQVLGGGSTSRLYRSLVIDQKIATEAGAWYSGDALDTGSFGAYAVPPPGKEIAPLEAALDKALAEVVEKGVTQEELTLAKNLLIAQTTYALDSSSQLARMFGQTLAIGGTVEDVTGWDARVEKVTLADVQAAAAEVLVLRGSVTSTLLPAPGAAAAAGGPAIAVPGAVQN